MPRQPKNILIIPYFFNNGDILYSLFKRGALYN